MDRELDVRVAQAMECWVLWHEPAPGSDEGYPSCWCEDKAEVDPNGREDELYHWSTDIAAAWRLVEHYQSPEKAKDGRKLYFDETVRVFHAHSGDWYCWLNVWGDLECDRPWHRGKGATASEAICLAFLATKEK